MPDRLACLICNSTPVQPMLNLTEEGVSHGEAGHNFTYSYRTLAVCEICGCGQLEYLDHDCFSYDEDWDMYWWYALGPSEVQQLCEALAACPAPLDACCMCAIHQALRASSRRLWGGRPHTTSPRQKASFSWLSLREEEQHLQLMIDIQQPFHVLTSDAGVEVYDASGDPFSLAWDDLRTVLIETTDEGPISNDVFWILIGTRGECRIPQGVAGEKALLPRLQRLLEFDNEAVIAAMLSTENRLFLCWQHRREDGTVS